MCRLPEHDAEFLASLDPITQELIRFRQMSVTERQDFLDPDFVIANSIRNDIRSKGEVDLDLLRNFDFDRLYYSSPRSFSLEEFKDELDLTRRYYSANIEMYGKDALAHICLPLIKFMTLWDVDRIGKISLVNGYLLKKGITLETPDHVGKVNGYDRIVASLYADWRMEAGIQE